MVTISLKDYVSEVGQVRAGMRLGVTQIAISKAIRSGRDIHISIFDDGSVSAYEIKGFPARKVVSGQTNAS